MTLLLVCSEADVPSVNMRASLLSSGGWDDLGEEDGRACMMKGDLALLSVPTEHIRSDGVDRAAAAFGVEPEAAVFMSRHSSASGIPTLTVHPVGNLGASADLGGRPRALVPAAPALMGDALRRISAHGYPGFRVSYEVTHHGPWLSVPSMFIEIGSDASTWGDAGAAAVLADVIASMEPVRHPVAVGIGGGHYAPRFTEVALGRGVDFGHMVPKHALDGADDEETASMLRMAAEASSTGLAYVHRSSFKGAEYRRVAALAESAGLELASSKDFDPLRADDRALYRPPQEGALQLLQVPAVDHQDVDPALRGDPHAQRVEDRRPPGVVVAVDDLPQPGDGHLRVPDGVGVRPRVRGVHRVHVAGVDDAVRLQDPRDRRGDRVRGVAGLGAAHDRDPARRRHPRALLRRLRDRAGGQPAEGDREQARVGPGDCDAQPVQLVHRPAELPAGIDVEAGEPAAAADDGELHLLGGRRDHVRQAPDVGGVTLSGDEHRPSDGNNDLLQVSHQYLYYVSGLPIKNLLVIEMAAEESIERAKYDFKKAMQELVSVKGRGTELISVYIPTTKQISDVMAYLRDEYSQASNIKSKSTMKNVMGSIESIMSRLRTYKTIPPNGVVIFCGEIPRAGDQTRMKQYVLDPPDPVTAFTYQCDSQFYTAPLEAMLVDKKCYGLITIDRKEATLGLLSGTSIKSLKHFDSLVPSKHHQGGQSSVRFERLIEIAAHEFFKKVADNATDAFLSRTEMIGLLIGGPGATKEFFIKEGYLHHELQKKVVQPLFDTGYTDESGLKELVDAAQGVIHDIDLMKEKKYVQRLFAEIRKTDGGLSCYGENEVRAAVALGAVDVLLLSDGIDKRRIKLRCQSGHEREETVDDSDRRFQCKECGQNAAVVEDEDLIDDFFERAEQFSTQVMIISVDSEEGQMLLSAFGGIAAILRYRIQ